MRCRNTPKLLSLRMDGRLSAPRTTELEQHLAHCSSCRGMACRMERAWDALTALDAPRPAPDDWSTIEAAVEARRRRWLPAWMDPGLVPTRVFAAAIVIAMAVVGGAGGILLGRELPPSRPAPLEPELIAETLGDLPWNSPATGLEPVLYAPRAEEVRP